MDAGAMRGSRYFTAYKTAYAGGDYIYYTWRYIIVYREVVCNTMHHVCAAQYDGYMTITPVYIYLIPVCKGYPAVPDENT